MESKDLPNKYKKVLVVRINAENGRKYVSILDLQGDTGEAYRFEVTKEFDGNWQEIPFNGVYLDKFAEINSLPK